MTTKRTPPSDPTALRRLAEEQSRERKAEKAPPGTEQDAPRLLHELQVHQIELEMQSAELLVSHAELLATHAEVKAGRDRYVDLYDFAPVGYFTLARDATIRQANLTAAGMLGVDRSKLVNRRLGIFLAEDSRLAFNAFLAGVFDGQASNTFEAVILREGREPLVVEMKATCGDGLEARVTMTDITARKRGEESLKRAHGQLSLAQQSAGAGVWDWDMITGTLEWSPEMFRLFRLDPTTTSATFEAWRNVMHPGDREAAEQRLRDAIQNRRRLENEYRIVLPSGETRWINTWGNSTYDGDRPVRMAGICIDITDRKVSEERDSTILKTAMDGFWIIDGQGHILEVNDAFCQKVGYSQGELITMSLLDLEVTERPEETVEHIRRIVATGKDRFETRHRRKDGTIIDVEVSVTYMGEQSKQFFSFVRDITERKTLEAQLLQAQKMEAIGRLAGGVAHDFRNQLTVIMGYGQMMLRRKLVKDEGLAMLEAVLQAAERSSTITGQLLAFSRKETLCSSVQSIRDVIADIGKILPHMVGEDIHMMIQLSTDVCQANIDAHLFQQAIMNLATNARDAMPEGGTLTIETACVTLGPESRRIDPELAEGPYVVVTVSDTGSGMDAATLARVFDPFFTTKEVGKGTGLGLAMVYGFVKQSGGAVAMQSELGQGTTTRLYFPLAAASPAAVLGEQPAGALQGGGETLLLVEDEPAVRAMAVTLLREVGYRVLEAADAEEALPLAERCDGEIDVLVTDVVMPGISGAVLAEQLKARYPGMGVLYISGYPGEELSSRGVDESMNAVGKPFKAELLLKKVRYALDNRKAAP